MISFECVYVFFFLSIHSTSIHRSSTYKNSNSLEAQLNECIQFDQANAHSRQRCDIRIITYVHWQFSPHSYEPEKLNELSTYCYSRKTITKDSSKKEFRYLILILSNSQSACVSTKWPQQLSESTSYPLTNLISE